MKLRLILIIGVLLVHFNAPAYSLMGLAQLMIRGALIRSKKLKAQQPMTPAQVRMHYEVRNAPEIFYRRAQFLKRHLQGDKHEK